jgi:hypothetical protein
MKILIEINIDNAAFEIDPVEEITRILATLPATTLAAEIQFSRGLADVDQVRRETELPAGPQRLFGCMDFNGNMVGGVYLQY